MGNIVQNAPFGSVQPSLMKNLYEVIGIEKILNVKLDIHIINTIGAVKCFLIFDCFRIMIIAITLTVVPKRLHNAAPIP